MAKPKNSINDAIATAKALRQNLDDESEVADTNNPSTRQSTNGLKNTKRNATEIRSDETIPINVLSNWVRHTTGLRHRTKLRLQDAVDGQKKKARYGQLQGEEPRNEQEIVERGVNLVLIELGYLEPNAKDRLTSLELGFS